MNPNLGQMVDTPTWPFSLPNPSNVAAFTETLNSYQIQVRSLVGAFQALQSLGQLTSSITASLCSRSNTSQAFPPQWLAFTICLKCPFFPFSHGASARPSRAHTEMPHLPWHIPTSSGKPAFPSLSSLSHRASRGTCLSVIYVPWGMAPSVNSLWAAVCQSPHTG